MVLESAFKKFVAIALFFALTMGTYTTGYAMIFMGGVATEQDNGDVIMRVEDVNFQSVGAVKDAKNEMLRVLRADSTPNTVSAIKTMPPAGMKGLYLDVKQFGVIVEPTDKKEITVDLIGVKYPGKVSVTTTTYNGVLSVKVNGEKADRLLISTVPADVINVVRIGIPAGSIQGVAFDERGSSCILFNNIDRPVTGQVANGIVRVWDDILNANVSMTAENGAAIVRSDTVNGLVNINVENGSASVKAKTVVGKAELHAENGRVTLDAGSVKNANLSAENGFVEFEADTIVEKVSAKVENGRLVGKLTAKPQNLKFMLDAQNAFYSNVKLPQGWYNGYTIGSGIPVLELGVKNGVLEMTAAD